jgi:hypothetical protein
MKSLPLIVPDGCALTPAQLGDQAGRAERLLPSVARVEQSGDELRVAFDGDVDGELVDELVATEQTCCSFLGVDYDRAARTLRVGAGDAQGREVVRRLAGFFEEGR